MNARRAWVAIVAGLLLLLLLRLLWGAVATHRVEREMALARPAPLSHAELFVTPNAAGDDPANNAVPLLLDAMNAAQTANDAQLDTPSQSDQVLPSQPPFPPLWHTMMDVALAHPGNVKALALARQARGRAAIRWNASAADLKAAGNGRSVYNEARNLANLLADAAQHAQEHGDDAEALRRVRDELHLARAVGRQGTFIAHLIRIGIAASAIQRAMVIASGLGHSSPLPPAVRAEAGALIRELIDTTDESAAMRDAFAGERIEQIDTIRREAAATWVTRPLYELDLARVLRADRTLIKAAELDNWPAAHAMLLADPAMPDFGGRISTKTTPRFSRFLGDRIVSFADRALQTDMRGREERRFAAIALAVALYRADHNGASPPRLDALVPAYLQSIPNDPFASNRPISYLVIPNGTPSGAVRHLLYSIGENGIDDTASGAQLPPTSAEYGWTNTGRLDDQHRDLDRW
jgi:hypothetical protein